MEGHEIGANNQARERLGGPNHLATTVYAGHHGEDAGKIGPNQHGQYTEAIENIGGLLAHQYGIRRETSHRWLPE